MTSMIDLGFGEYPIVLSDALLGRATNELYTGINYSQNTAIDSYSSRPHKLAPSGEKANNYGLSFPDTSDNFSFQGERTPAEHQYVLIFDADQEQFVLHRVDSNFDMKRVNPSRSKNTTSSRPHHSQAEPRTKHQTPAPPKKSSKETPAVIVESQRKAKSPKRTIQPDPSPETGEVEEDSDDGLIIEAPGAHSPGNQQRKASPVHHRQPSEKDSDDEGNAAQGESADSEQTAEHPNHLSPSLNAPLEMSDEEMELALEAELEQELLKDSAENMADESDESEEE